MNVLDAAIAAAHEAAKFLMTGYRQHVAYEHKGRADLVTRFDRESEAMIRARLEGYHPVIGEEAGGESIEGRPVFFIDPLDGTTNFVHGHPFFCVSIGLVDAGVPVLGVVVAPALGIEWIGMPGQIATRDGQPCRVSQATEFDQSLLATGFPSTNRHDPAMNNFDAFFAIKQRCQAVRRCGSAAIDLCLVADGTYEGYWERRLHPWDLAGGAAVVAAAGGRVTDDEGSSSFVKTGSVVATNGVIHAELLAELARVSLARR